MWDKKKEVKGTKKSKKLKCSKNVHVHAKSVTVRIQHLLLVSLLLQVMLPAGWMISESAKGNESWRLGRELDGWMNNDLPLQGSSNWLEWERIMYIPVYNAQTFHSMNSKNSRRRISNKLANKRIKSINGNRAQNLRIVHWNLGSRRWENKTDEIEALINEKEVDLCFISEANLWSEVPDHDRIIPGFHLIYPETMDTMMHARIMLLVKDGIIVSRLQEQDTGSASIWVRIGHGRNSSLTVGGIYREHLRLGQTDRNISRQELLRLQEARWNVIIRKWKQMGLHGKCIVIGDVNLDHLRWNNPEQHHEHMVDCVKNLIEIDGFVQLVENHTRTMRHQTDSLLDHIWSNCHHRTVSITNEVRGDSDHNVIGIVVATKYIKSSGHNILRRSWKNFNKERCLTQLRLLDWNSILLESNADIANSKFEDMVNGVMNKEAPMKVIQQRINYCKWLSTETKDLMQDRDLARESAKLTGSNVDWETYKFLRNASTKAQRKDKTAHLNKIYSLIEEESNPGKLFSTTKHLLGWSSSGPPQLFHYWGSTCQETGGYCRGTV